MAPGRGLPAVFARPSGIGDGAPSSSKPVLPSAAGFGPNPDHLLIMPGVPLYVGRTQAEAEAKFQQMHDLIDPLTGLAALFSYFGDLSGYDLDGPVPEPTDAAVKSIAGNLYNRAQRENAAIPNGLDDFIELVLPEIRRRGLFRTEYEGTTLRENLGLRYPARGDIAERSLVAAE